MKRAHKRNARDEQTFFFRKSIFKRSRSLFSHGVHGINGHANGNGSTSHSRTRTTSARSESANSSANPSRAGSPAPQAIEDEYEEMTINEIINGKGPNFPGLLGLVYAYINSLNVDFATRCDLDRYLQLVKGRANGMPCPFFV